MSGRPITVAALVARIEAEAGQRPTARHTPAVPLAEDPPTEPIRLARPYVTQRSSTVQTSPAARRFYGPHCPHDECGLLDCRAGTTPTIVHPCSAQDTCPACGPGGAYWTLAAQHMTARLILVFGTTNVERIRNAPNIAACDVKAGVRFAELLRDNPPRP